MKAAAIICEYNPFHNGHLLQIEKIKSAFPKKPIVAVMSGNFVQRGDVAVAEKFTRAETAIRNGVNLVLELPFPYSIFSAELFAEGAIFIMNSVGFVDTLVCGAEDNDVELLSKIADVILDDAFELEVEEVIKEDRSLSYPSARQKALEKKINNSADILKGANNILAIEYIKAIKKLKSAIVPIVLKRDTVLHDSMNPNEDIASATYIRELIRNGEYENASKYIPKSGYDLLLFDMNNGSFPRDIQRIEKSILAFFRLTDEETLQRYYLVDFSLASAIVKNAPKCNTFSQLLNTLKNKHITMAKLRRVLLGAYLGVLKEDAKSLPPYTNLLAADSVGCELLKCADSFFPIFSKYSLALNNKNSQIASMAKLQNKAESIFQMCAPKLQDGNKFIKTSPKIFK